MAATAVPPTTGGGGGVAQTPLPLDGAVALFVRAAVVTRAQNRSVDEYAFIATERKAPLPAVNTLHALPRLVLQGRHQGHHRAQRLLQGDGADGTRAPVRRQAARVHQPERAE